MIKCKNGFIVIPPGETIKEVMENNSITKNQLQQKLCISLDTLEDLLEGDIPLTEHIAEQLEAIFDIDKQFWINLEENYRKEL